MTTLNRINDGFIREMRTLASVEEHLIETLPRMARVCGCEELRRAFEQRLTEAQAHYEHISSILRSISPVAMNEDDCANLTTPRDIPHKAA